MFTRAHTGKVITRPSKEELKARPLCDLCYASFPKFGDLYKHKGRLCFESAILSQPYPNPVRVYFEEEQMTYVSDCLLSLGLPVCEEAEGEKKGKKYVEVDRSMCEILLRRLYTCQVTKYNIESWYPSLERRANELGNARGFTAHTLFLPLSDEELRTLQKWSSMELSNVLGMPSRPTNQELENRERLEDRISEAIQSDRERQLERGKVFCVTGLRVEVGKYFLKFSTRSPKDAVSISKEDENLPVDIQIAKKIEKLCIQDGQQAFALLIRSQRIFSDTTMYFQYRVSHSSSESLSLILRDWIPCPQDHEFRCFVHGRQLSAISQYHCYSFFPSLQQMSHVLRIRDAIQNFVKQIIDCFSIPSFVLDLVVDPYSYHCFIIELNPFGRSMSSGSALYNWDRDYELLYGIQKRKMPSIRILRELLDDNQM